MELFEGMLQKDKEEFRRVCNKLMSICFICKQNEDTKSDYYFIQRQKHVFLRYLDVLGYTLEINEEYGVIQLVNRENYNHRQLKLYDSIILLILRILSAPEQQAAIRFCAASAPHTSPAPWRPKRRLPRR